MSARPFLGIVIAGFLCESNSEAMAHGMRTAYLELTETESGTVEVAWKMPTLDENVRPRFPEGCAVAAESADSSSTETKAYGLACHGALSGKTLGVEGLGPLVSEVVVRVAFRDGRCASTVLTRDAPTWTLPANESWRAIARDYGLLGVDHILSGPDHLLFVVALLLLTGSFRRGLGAVTAFSIGHSVTLVATALGVLRISSHAAEAAIALSLVIVALDLGRKSTESPHGASLASAFGLIHGLGFAGALSELGLPEQAIPLALASFNVGVEIGQLIFITASLLVWTFVSRTKHVRRFTIATAHVIGGVGAFWLIERTLMMLP